MNIFTTYGMLTNKELKEYEDWAKESILTDDIEKETITDVEIMEAINIDIQIGFEDIYNYDLNRQINNTILAIASIGRWNGNFSGYKILSNNLHDILDNFNCDEYVIYTDKHNVKFKGYHHDGRNYIEFRAIRDGVNIDNLLNKIYNNESISRSVLNYYTKSLKPYITEIYGV